VRILEGLPVHGPDPHRFSATGQGLHSEGLVVEFKSGDDSTWIGNFVREEMTYDSVELHPDRVHVLVIAGGQGYIVDARARTVVETFGTAIVCSFRHATRDLVVFCHQWVDFTALGPRGWVWKSPRVSYEGMRALEMGREVLRGEALDLDDSWVPFELDLATGTLSGGSFPTSVVES
jgi:hypothetical protein